MADDPLIGYQSDSLRFDSLLGKGAMGAVYKGTQLGLDRVVAIKVIAPHLAEDKPYIERFLREAQTLGKLIHPNVIACHDTVHGTGPNGAPLLMMVLEFVDGWSLGSLLKKKHKLTVRQVLELHRQAAEGLAAAHRLNIVHRDIKPDNLMVTRTGQAKLADFGLAKADDSAMLTQTGAIMGSPSYMSPEACRGEAPNASSDIYSLGCSLFHSLTGRTPFTASTSLQAIHAHINQPPPRLSSLRGDLMPLDGLLLRLLAKLKSQRPRDASAVAAEIKAAITTVPADLIAGDIPGAAPARNVVAPAGQPSAPTSPTVPRAAPPSSPRNARANATPATETPPTKKRRWPLIAGGVGMLFLLLLIVSAGKDKDHGKKSKNGPNSLAEAAGTPDGGTADDQRLRDLEATLGKVDALLAQQQPGEAKALLDAHPIPAELPFADLAQRSTTLRKRIADSTPPAPNESPLDAAERALTEGRPADAEALLAKPVSDDLASRRDALRLRLPQAWKDEAQRIDAALAEAETDIGANRATEAVTALEALTIPTRFPLQTKRRDTLLAQAREHDQPVASTATLPLANGVTVLKRGPQGVDGMRAIPGFPDLPARIPGGDTELVFCRSGGDLRIAVPAGSGGPGDGVTLVIHSMQPTELRVMAGTKELPAIGLTGKDWGLARISFAGMAAPVKELTISAKPASAFLIAKAVSGRGLVPSVADLAMAPGTLLAMPYGERGSAYESNGFHAQILTCCKANGTFADLEQMVVAVPPESRAVGERMLATSMRFLRQPAPTAGDPRVVQIPGGDATQAFAAALKAKANLFQMALATDSQPRTGAAEMARLCRDAISQGTLPILVLSATGGWQPKVRTLWQEWISALQRELPGQPIIDLGEVPTFVQRHELRVLPPTPAYLTMIDASYEAGLRELIERTKWVITFGGGRRSARLGDDGPLRPKPIIKR